MKRSKDRILTTHTGSMPRNPQVLALLRCKAAGEHLDQTAFDALIDQEACSTVRRQVEAGIDVVNDGECAKPSFVTYVWERMAGFEPKRLEGNAAQAGPLSRGGRDEQMFPDYYNWLFAHNPFAEIIPITPHVCVAPISYTGSAQVGQDITRLKQAMSQAGASEGFMTSATPIPNGGLNRHYGSESEFQAAYADAIREEYKEILDAGLLLQIDDPFMASSWDARTDMSLKDYRKWAERRVELLNHALRGLPASRIRYHTCYGVNFGPRVSDLQLADIVDVLFKINAGAYSFEAANPRHEHEWRLFDRVGLPEDKVLIPGVITHSNVMVEHPDVIADRIVRWAETIGRDNLIVGNDCGFASVAGNAEIPMTVAWAKLRALGEGARLATQRLWS